MLIDLKPPTALLPTRDLQDFIITLTHSHDPKPLRLFLPWNIFYDLNFWQFHTCIYDNEVHPFALLVFPQLTYFFQTRPPLTFVSFCVWGGLGKTESSSCVTVARSCRWQPFTTLSLDPGSFSAPSVVCPEPWQRCTHCYTQGWTLNRHLLSASDWLWSLCINRGSLQNKLLNRQTVARF